MIEKTSAEKAAEQGTVGACWDGYRDNVVRETVRLVGLPRSDADHEHSSRMDFYAGAASVFQILRAMYSRGVPPSGRILADLEDEVTTWLETADATQHKPGHA